jgi:hypothetical protein
MRVYSQSLQKKLNNSGKKISRMALQTQLDYWHKLVTGSAVVACIFMLQWQSN